MDALIKPAQQENRHSLPRPFYQAWKAPLCLAGILAVTWLFAGFTGWQWGILPLSNGMPPSWLGLVWDMATFHLGHGSAAHLVSNLLPLIILGTLAGMFFPSALRKSWLWLWLGSGFILWAIGRPGVHLGASALTYGLFHLVFWLGVLRRDRLSLTALVLAVLGFGQMFLAFWPHHGVSWEGHLAGAMMGAWAAWLNRAADPKPAPKVWDDEEDDAAPDPPRFPVEDELTTLVGRGSSLPVPPAPPIQTRP